MLKKLNLKSKICKKDGVVIQAGVVEPEMFKFKLLNFVTF